jgi:hypothetical protein
LKDQQQRATSEIKNKDQQQRGTKRSTTKSNNKD